MSLVWNNFQRLYYAFIKLTVGVEDVKDSCWSAEGQHHSHLHWSFFIFHFRPLALDWTRILPARECVGFCCFFQTIVNSLHVSYLHKWGCQQSLHWKSPCFSWEVWNLHGLEVPWQLTPINSSKHQIEMSMAIVCIALLIVKSSRTYLLFWMLGFFKSGKMWPEWGTWWTLRGWIRLDFKNRISFVRNV